MSVVDSLRASLTLLPQLLMRVLRMRTSTRITLVFVIMASTMLYYVLLEKHDQYSAEANSGNRPHIHQGSEKEQGIQDEKESKFCEGEDCPPKKKHNTIEEIMKKPLSDGQKKRMLDRLRDEVPEYANLPPFEELKKMWSKKQEEVKWNKLRQEALKEPGEKEAAQEWKQFDEQEEKSNENSLRQGSVEQDDSSTIHLAVVACGDRMEETLVMLKSATIFTRAPLKFHIFTEDDLKEEFTKQLIGWPDIVKKKFTFQLYPISFPGVQNPDAWKSFFKPCACQRLFLPYIITSVEKLLYVDTDILFFSPLEDIWSFFDKFNSTQISALTPEHEASWMGWYNRFARHPYYGEMGVNSGVMLMNLSLMRISRWMPLMAQYFTIYRLNMTWGDQDLINVFFHNYPGVNSGIMLMHLERFRTQSDWLNLMQEYRRKYDKRTTWGDQDLINIFFHFHPEKLYVYPCEWNYRADHCMYGLVCKTAENEGVRIVHGNRGVYHNEKQPVFKAIYETLKQYMWGGDPNSGLLQPLELKFKDAELLDTYCGKSAHVLIKGLRRTIREFTRTKR